MEVRITRESEKKPESRTTVKEEKQEREKRTPKKETGVVAGLAIAKKKWGNEKQKGIVLVNKTSDGHYVGGAAETVSGNISTGYGQQKHGSIEIGVKVSERDELATN